MYNTTESENSQNKMAIFMADEVHVMHSCVIKKNVKFKMFFRMQKAITVSLQHQKQWHIQLLKAFNIQE